MPTSLTNDKMHPALRSRIEAAVGARPTTGRRFAPLLRLGFRAAVLTVVIGATWALVSEHQARAERLEDAKTTLRESLEGVEADLARSAMVTALSGWIRTEAGRYGGDVVSPALGASGLSARLAGPMVYVRAPTDALDRPHGLETSAVDSLPDAFVHCLVEPPGGDAEKVMHRSLEAAFGDPSDWQRRMATVFRAHDVLLARAFDREGWSRRLEEADELPEVAALGRELDEAHLDRAAFAAQAETLVVVLDEPKPRDVVADLDGAHRHHVRVTLVDATTGRALVRLRREVDPEWISDGHRTYFGRSLVACRLALEVRARVAREI